MGLQLHRSFPFVDFVCGGEADISFPRLIQALMAGKEPAEIPGVISRCRGGSFSVSLNPERVADMNVLPYPNYDDYFEQVASVCPAFKSLSGVLIESSRGCWWGDKHHCTFCGLNGTSMTFRSKTAGRVIEEIVGLCHKYNSRFVEM